MPSAVMWSSYAVDELVDRGKTELYLLFIYTCVCVCILLTLIGKGSNCHLLMPVSQVDLDFLGFHYEIV